MASGVRYQTSLFGDREREAEAGFDAGFSGMQRIHLDASAWIDLVPRWVTGADRLFEQLVPTKAWSQRTRRMYDHDVLEPRLTARWTLASGQPLDPPVLERMRVALSSRYGVTFDSAGFNLYRDGGDGVAWHRDTIAKHIDHPVVPLVSLGEPRKLAFRPRGGGRSRSFVVGHGDLLVTGGSSQRTWEHAVLKVARAGARISIAFRYGLVLAGYGRSPSEAGEADELVERADDPSTDTP